jgi:hypothetical protein
MTLKSKLAGLVTVLLVLVMAPGLFAQVSISIIPDTDPGDIQTNNNALAAVPGSNGSGVLVVGSLIATSPLSTTVLRINYPAPITSLPSLVGGSTANCTIGGFSALNTGNGGGGAFACGPSAGVPAADPIRIVGASGVFSSMNVQPLLNTTNQRVEIQLPASGSNSSSGSFRLVGVRINANGLTGAQTVTASLNTQVNNYLLGTPSSGTIINTLNPGISATGLSIGLAPGNTTIQTNSSFGPGTATIFTNRNLARSAGAFILTEGCASCWRTRTQNGNAGAALPNSTQIRLTFNNVPTGVTISLAVPPPPIGTTSGNSSLAASIGNTSITSTANTAVIDFTSTSLTQIETLEVDFAVAVTTTAAVTTPGSITVTATMFPVSTTPFDTTSTGNGPGGITLTGLPTESSGYPTFTDLEVGPLTVVNIVPASTTMLMPYALVLPPFDTGLAVANTTADPFGAGAGGATPASGTLVLNFFPTTATGAGTSFSLTTSSTVRPGTGLSSDGTLAPGATWSVLLSQLLTAAGQTGTFQGYVFIQANFLNAHGTATISDFRTYSLTANVLVLPPPAIFPRSGGTASVEALNQ